MAAEVAAAPAPTVPAAAAGKDDKPKERVKRLERPDRTILDSQSEKLMAQVERCQARILEIKSIIDAKKNNRRGMSSGPGGAARQALNGLRAEFKAALDEKNAIRERLQASDAARDALRAQAKAVKEKLSFVRVEQIDEEISRIEHVMSHTTMTLNEEKKLLTQVKDLSKSRMFVKEYNERMEKISVDEDARKQLTEAIKGIDERINGIKAREMEHRATMDSIRAKEETESADIPALTEERNASYELIKEAKGAINKLRNEFKAKEDDYYQREREFRNQMREEKQQRWEASQAERKQRDVERKKRDLEYMGEPYDKEVTSCDQLIAYLARFCPKEAEEKKEEEKKDLSSFDGRQMLVKKKNMDDFGDLDGMFGGLGGGKKGKGKKGKGLTEKAAAPAKLSLSLDMMSSLTSVKVEVPLTVADVPACVEALKAKKENFLERRVVKKAELLKAAEQAEVDAERAATKSAPVRGPIALTMAVEGDEVKVTLRVKGPRNEGRGYNNRERGEKKEAAPAAEASS